MGGNLGPVRESWLRGGDTDLDHERFGAAMVKCQMGYGRCGELGECAYGGDCFRSATSAAREASRMVKALTTTSAEIQGWINDAADWLEQQARATRQDKGE